MKSIGLSYVFHVLIQLTSLGHVNCQFEQTTYGASLYTPTQGAPVETVSVPASKPTLIYNCAWMPAICNNVKAVEGNGFTSRTLVYDKNEARSVERYKNTCPTRGLSAWKQVHTCPEPNQPGVINAQGGPSRPGPIGLANPALPRTNPAAFEILLPLGMPPSQKGSGLRYSCDEYPPKKFIQGGAGVPGARGTFNTYCAPISYCSKTDPFSTSSEQNWQGSSHSLLQGRLGAGNSLYSVTFGIENKPDDPFAAKVIWNIENGEFLDSVKPEKRDLDVWEMNGNETSPKMITLMSGIHAFKRTTMHHIIETRDGDVVLRRVSKKKVARIEARSQQQGLAKRQVPAVNPAAIPSSSVSAVAPVASNTTGIPGANGNVSEPLTGSSPVQQNFDASSAPVDIQQLSPTYITGNETTTLNFNATSWNDSPLLGGAIQPRALDVTEKVAGAWDMAPAVEVDPQGFTFFDKRAAEAIQCGPNQPCADGSCCNNANKCGYGVEHCGKGNCTSNCGATAMCGKDSAGGKVKCGLNLCCSFYGWCGTEAIHCINSDTVNKQAPCQKGFGSCAIVPPPVCGKGSGSASRGRKIGYYQASNVRLRACNRITPAQIKTDGLTHLFFAFAVIDPVSFKITPSDPGDVDLYHQFTALKKPGLQTWIAVGGFDFSDVGPTRTTWSDMASSPVNRGAFIGSLVAFMNLYGFDGVDFDWEYPAADTRGGRPEDTQNLVSLVKEMREAFGTKGISMTLAPDYWYLRGFDPKAMESSVDFFGFMSYDLHGSWDADVKTLGSVIRPQTDIRDIDVDLLPLWFDALDPRKVNFGLAYYGRGYTVSDSSCTHLGCPFSGPSKPAPCTNFPGVMSLREIQNTITRTKAVPQLIPNAMVKQIVFDNDQWIGYDDDDTIALKIQYADDACLGGTMIWSVDFDSGEGSGDTPDGGANAAGADTPIVYSTDGSCGLTHGNTFCSAQTDAYHGVCCSASGFCGSTPAYCGSGCQSGCDGKQVMQAGNSANSSAGGATLPGTVTYSTNGACGSKNGNTFCSANTDAYNGTCCSLSGFCGTGVQYCGAGCQSGCDGNEVTETDSDASSVGDNVFIDPSIWTTNPADLSCHAPCQLILPPFPLGAPANVPIPPLSASWTVTQTLQSVGAQNGVPVTANSVTEYLISSVISQSPVVASSIDISAIKIPPGQTPLELSVQPIITPNPVVVVYPVNPIDNSGPQSTSSGAAAAAFFGGKAPGGTRTRTIFPPPIIYPSPPPFPKLNWQDGPPKPVCKINCGKPPPHGNDDDNDNEDNNQTDDDNENGSENNHGKCSGDDCGSNDNESSSQNGGCKGLNCPNGDNGSSSSGSAPGGNDNDEEDDDDDDDDEEGEYCTLQPQEITEPDPDASTPSKTPDKPLPPNPVPKPEPKPKPERGPNICKLWEDNYDACFKDIHAASVDECASVMFVQLPNGPMTSTSPNVTQVYREHASGGEGGKGVTYMMNIGWIPGCTITDSQPADNPLGKSGDGSISYTDLIKDTYYQCTGNHGLGGYVDVGCLRYGFYPNDINGVFGSPPHPELYWEANGNICG